MANKLGGYLSEMLCIQWSNFKENVKKCYGYFREDKHFNDVTLACGDGQQMEAHKVILAFSGLPEVACKEQTPTPFGLYEPSPICLLRSVASLKDFSHRAHMRGFSPG